MTSVDDKIFELKQLREELKKKVNASGDKNLAGIAAEKGVEEVVACAPAQRRDLITPNGHVEDIAWANDGHRIVGCLSEGKILVWDAYLEYHACTIHLKKMKAHSVSISPDDAHIACGTDSGICAIYNLDEALSGGSIRASKLTGHPAYIGSTAFVSNRNLLTGCGDTFVRMWDLQLSKRLATLAGHSGDINDLHVNYNGRTFYSAGADGLVNLWDVTSEKLVHSYQITPAGVSSVVAPPGIDAFLAGAEDGSCKMIDVRMGATINEYKSDTEMWPVVDLDISSTGRLIYTGYTSSDVMIYDAVTAKSLGVIHAHDMHLTSVRTSPDGCAFATAAWDGSIKIWS
eukprot:Clim_evm13s243 gene=Clim_evmTU13s243